MENSDLKDRVNSLVTELSIKEATWCENEEKLKIEVRDNVPYAQYKYRSNTNMTYIILLH